MMAYTLIACSQKELSYKMYSMAVAVYFRWMELSINSVIDDY